MLKSMTLKNFTVFADSEFKFGANLNVFIGENGLGKTHVLKVAYATVRSSVEGGRELMSAVPTKSFLQSAIARKLRGVFRPDELGRLARRQSGRSRCEVGLSFAPGELDCRFSFNTASKSEVGIETVPRAWIDSLPVFLPSRELLTIFPGFVSLYDTTDLPFEEIWRDTCLLLGVPMAKGPRLKQIKVLLEPLEVAMGGKVLLEQPGRFYIVTETGKMEMHLVAEGWRKLATLAWLMATGSILGKGFLFWDEPEANLNPKLIKTIARTILQTSGSGIQVFIATHSLFLMRELHVLAQGDEFRNVDSRFFGLHAGEDGVTVRQGTTLDDIGEIVSLDEELSQSARYLDILRAE